MFSFFKQLPLELNFKDNDAKKEDLFDNHERLDNFEEDSDILGDLQNEIDMENSEKEDAVSIKNNNKINEIDKLKKDIINILNEYQGLDFELQNLKGRLLDLLK